MYSQKPVEPIGTGQQGRKQTELWRQRHQGQEHIRVLGSNILSAWTPLTQQAEIYHGTAPVPGKETLPGRGWQLPYALQQMLKQVRSHQTAAMQVSSKACQHGEAQTGPHLCQHCHGAKQLPGSQPGTPEQHHMARDLKHKHAVDAMHVSV